jgi:hypothetical protein
MAMSPARALEPVKRVGREKKSFKGLKFDEEGRFLVMHHRGAAF